MNYFGITAYDPIDGSSTSIDPLNSLAISVNLADLVFPGSSGRIWKIRYLSAICYLIYCAKTDEDKSYKENYLNCRRWENIFILASTVVKNEKEIPGLTGLMGTSKAAKLIENSARASVDISGEILSNQMNLGPLGVHSVILKSLGLVEDNLILTNTGRALAELYRNNSGDTGLVIGELGTKNRADIEKLKTRINAEEFSFDLSQKPKEADAIFQLLIDNPNRAQLFRDINRFRIVDESDKDDVYVKVLTAAENSSNQLAYKLIYHFESFQRKLHTFFYHFLKSPIPKAIDRYEDARNYLESSSADLIEHGGNFKILVQQLPGAEAKEYNKYIALLDNLLPRVNSFEEFSHYVINELHGAHQAYKHKAPWIKFENGLIYPSSVNLKGEKDLNEGRLHRYRFANADTILNDLGKLKYK